MSDEARDIYHASTVEKEEDIELVEMVADTAAREPLISESRRRAPNGPNARQWHDAPSLGVGGGTEEDDEDDERIQPTAFVWMLVLAAGISGLLFGYDTGVISSTLVSIHTDLSSRALTSLDKSLITSSTSFCALLVSPCTGFLADTLGRKRVILFASIIFIVGALWQASCSTVWAMIIGRGIVGFAVGSASFVVPLYIGELSPSRFRGRLVTIASLFITGGQVVAYVVGWAFSTTPSGWRWMVGLGALPAAVQLFLLFAMPETPRWLAKAGREEQAAAVLTSVYGCTEGMDLVVDKVLHRIQQENIDEEKARMGRHSEDMKDGLMQTLGLGNTFGELLAIGGNRRALAIACLLQGAQQLCGFNSLMYFSATIFALVGFTSPTLTSLSVAFTNFIFTFVAFRSIDRVGRRRILLYSIPFMTLGLCLCALAFSFIDFPSTSSVSGHDTNTTTAPVAAEPSRFWSTALLLSLILYVSAYALGLGNVPWQQSELFPLSVRALGSGLATATNWGANTIVGLTFLPMMELATPSGTFFCYAGVCVVSWVVVWRCYPETAGLGLEEVGGLLKEGWGVKESIRIWEARKVRVESGVDFT